MLSVTATRHDSQPDLFWPSEPVVVQERSTPRSVTIAGRRLQLSPVFDTYWRYAAERQRVYEARLDGHPGPWSSDPILMRHRFTNCYRAADRVSQYLIKDVIYNGSQQPDEVLFRTLLFKFFNRISTWELLQGHLGEITWADFNLDVYDQILGNEFGRGGRLYSAAYIIPPPKLGGARKHTNHLLLLQRMMTDGLSSRLASARGMDDAFELLKSYPAMGDFLAFQMLIDLNYSNLTDFDEMDFVVAGPGARDGIRKCFGDQSRGIETSIIRYMSDAQEENFARLGLRFGGLRGRRLQLVDCQNLFCEVDKYARVAHPTIVGYSGRQRIKQQFAPVPNPCPAWFPPKWKLQQDDDGSTQDVSTVRLEERRPAPVHT